MRRFYGVAAAALLAGAAAPVWAEEAAPDDGVQLAGAGEALASEQLTVTATRTKRAADEVPSTVSVISDEEIEDRLVTDIKDLVRFEPGVSVRSSPSRFTAALSATGRDGNSGFNIRGLEGNRVLIQVDGIRVPDAFSFGAQSAGRGDYVDLDLLRSVEIVRGPASALYGSDGLAGVVSFETKDPLDFLKEDEAIAARVRASYASADDSWAESVVAAAQEGAWSGMVAITRRDGHELESKGENGSPDTTRTEANPQDVWSNAGLARLVFSPNARHRLRATYEQFESEIETEVLSARAIPPLSSTSTLDLDAHDETERQRGTLDYTYENAEAFLTRATLAAYYQDSETIQFSDEDRNTALDRTRLNTFDNRVWGFAGQVDMAFSFDGIENRLVVGGDYSQTRQEGVRDGTVPPFGETFPTRAFPNTDYMLAGLFVQDEIAMLDGRLTLFPALRFDTYDLEPEDDALFIGAIAGQSDSRFSPKLGAVYWVTENFGLYAQRAAGFKAPSPSQVNNGFSNISVGYESIPNPDLKPETSDTVEIGIRFRDIALAGGEWSAGVTAFDGEYQDFIEQVQVGGTFTPLDPAIFQYVNLGEVEIKGIEARVEGTWDNGFGFIAAASYAEGEQTSGGVTQPLASIEPWKISAGLSYRDPAGRFGGQIAGVYSAGKDADDAGLTCTGGCFLPSSFTFVDVTAYWNITDDLTLRAGVFNLTDEKYWWWGDVRGLSETSLTRDAYTQPGRNASVSLSYRF